MEPMHALNKWVVLEEIKEKTVESSILFIPDSPKDILKAKVTNLDSTVTEVAIGDLILVPSTAVTSIKLNGTDLKLAKINDILAIVG